MPRVTAATVEQVAQLARLSLSDAERDTFARQLDEILTYVETLESLDTRDVPPMSHAAAAVGFRDDQPRDGIDAGEALKSAPDAADGLFRVPRILGG